MEQDRHQPGLFETQPAPHDVAAAQPLHLDPTHAERGSASPEPSTGASTDAPDLTVDQAARQAAIIAALRSEFDARVDAAAAGRSHTPLTNSDNDEDVGYGYGYAKNQDESAGEQAGQEYGLST